MWAKIVLLFSKFLVSYYKIISDQKKKSLLIAKIENNNNYNEAFKGVNSQGYYTLTSYYKTSQTKKNSLFAILMSIHNSSNENGTCS